MTKKGKEADPEDEAGRESNPGDEDAEDENAEGEDAEGEDAEGEDASADEDDEDEDEDATDEDAADEERDESTKGVAKALGVDGDEEDAPGEQAPAAAAAPNRAARRREEAEQRRAKRTANRPKEDAEDGEEAVAARDALPKDKNARAKELLKRRKEAAESKGQIGLSASEVVQDQLARAASGTGRWFKKNFKVLLAAAVVGVGGTVGAIYFLDYQTAQIGAVSDELAKGFAADRAAVAKEDKRTDAEKAADPSPVFTSSAAKADAVLVAYAKVVAERPGSGAALIARLGQAGAHLDKGEPDQALAACDEILKSELAKADIDVRARTLETKGFALELKKELDAAFSVFKELESVDKSFEDLGKYHQARIHLAKAEPDKAKDILLALAKKLEVPVVDLTDPSGRGPQQSALREQVEEYLRALDPSRVAPRRSLAGPKATPSPLELENAQREAQRRMLEMQREKEGGDEPQLPGQDDGTH